MWTPPQRERPNHPPMSLSRLLTVLLGEICMSRGQTLQKASRSRSKVRKPIESSGQVVNAQVLSVGRIQQKSTRMWRRSSLEPTPHGPSTHRRHLQEPQNVIPKLEAPHILCLALRTLRKISTPLLVGVCACGDTQVGRSPAAGHRPDEVYRLLPSSGRRFGTQQPREPNMA